MWRALVAGMVRQTSVNDTVTLKRLSLDKLAVSVLANDKVEELSRSTMDCSIAYKVRPLASAQACGWQTNSSHQTAAPEREGPLLIAQ